MALLIHLDPFGVRFHFLEILALKFRLLLTIMEPNGPHAVLLKNGEKLCNSFFLQKSWPGYSKISRSLAVSTDYFLSVELHRSNICLCKKDTCIYLRGVAHNHSRRRTFIWVTISGKRRCSLAVHMLGLLTKYKTRRTTSQKEVCKLDFRTNCPFKQVWTLSKVITWA